MIPVADTSHVVAVTIASDKNHNNSLATHRKFTEIILPQTVLAEVAYLIGRSAGSERVAEFISGIPRSRYVLTAVTQPDLDRTAELLRQYADTRLDFVDATVIAIAERLNIDTVLTLDRRDFGMVRPRHVNALTLLPEATSS